MTDFDNIRLVFLSQLESLGAGQLFPTVRFSCTAGGFEYGVNYLFLCIHFTLSMKFYVVMHSPTYRKNKN